MSSNYEYVKAWRARRKNKGYVARFMKKRRDYYKRLWKRGDIRFKDIPVGYRPLKEWRRK